MIVRIVLELDDEAIAAEIEQDYDEFEFEVRPTPVKLVGDLLREGSYGDILGGGLFKRKRMTVELDGETLEIPA